MNTTNFNKEKIINYWIVGSDDDFDTMIAMLNTKRYSWSLFLGHLTIEKLLKAYYTKTVEDYPPFTHNLLKIAKDSKLELTKELTLQLVTITAFNLNTRYDDYKRSFHKKCTPEFTNEWVKKIKEIRKWIKEQINQ